MTTKKQFRKLNEDQNDSFKINKLNTVFTISVYSHGRGSDVSCDIEIWDPKVLHDTEFTLASDQYSNSWVTPAVI